MCHMAIRYLSYDCWSNQLNKISRYLKLKFLKHYNQQKTISTIVNILESRKCREKKKITVVIQYIINLTLRTLFPYISQFSKARLLK